jgi:hypothetical protein
VTTRILRSATCLAALLVLGACGAGGAPDLRAGDPGPPTAVPAAAGPVRGVGTVLDNGRPELCLGPVAESWPPQCHGIPLVRWSWAEHPGTFERAGGVRWGEYVVTGTFDGVRLTVTDAVPGATIDYALPEPAPAPDPPAVATRLEEIQHEIRSLPGLLSSTPDHGRLLVDVVHDDGSLQAWADATYGDGVVAVQSHLVPTTPG